MLKDSKLWTARYRNVTEAGNGTLAVSATYPVFIVFFKCPGDFASYFNGAKMFMQDNSVSPAMTGNVCFYPDTLVGCYPVVE